MRTRAQPSQQSPAEAGDEAAVGAEHDQHEQQQLEPAERAERARAARDEAVHRVTRGLVRIDARRRRRTIIRRLFLITLACAVLGGAGYYLSPYLPKYELHHFWEQVKSKLPIFSDESEQSD